MLLSAMLLFAGASRGADLSPVDRADVKKVIDQYVAAWLAGEPEKVMRLLTDDSVLIPAAKPPHVGARAIRDYWWPPDSPPFALTRFTNTIDQISGSGDSAVVRGTQVIEWKSGNEQWRTQGNYVSVLRRTAGTWRIAMQFAANTPNERVP